MTSKNSSRLKATWYVFIKGPISEQNSICHSLIFQKTPIVKKKSQNVGVKLENLTSYSSIRRSFQNVIVQVATKAPRPACFRVPEFGNLPKAKPMAGRHKQLKIDNWKLKIGIGVLVSLWQNIQ